MDEVVLRQYHWRRYLATEYCDKMGIEKKERNRLLKDPKSVMLLSRVYLDFLNNREEMAL